MSTPNETAFAHDEPSDRQADRTIGPVRLTFACELSTARLTDFFTDASIIRDLQALQARVTLMLSDLSSERASVVQRLNGAGVAVVAIPLLPFEEGYYFTADNAPRAQAPVRRVEVVDE